MQICKCAYFYNEKQHDFLLFSMKLRDFQEKTFKCTFELIFGQKKRNGGTQAAHWLKHDFCYLYGKTKNIIRHILTSVVMPLNFIHFRKKFLNVLL